MAGSFLDVFVKIGADTTDLENGIEKSKGLASGLGSAISTGMKVIGAAVAGATTAVTAFGASAVKNYAEYEQLVGGVETLYGNAYKSLDEYADAVGLSLEEASYSWEQYQSRQQDVLNNAANAYKTAGMDANTYMDTVNSFAASLNNSLGEYAWQSANYADMAVGDMADNANKMGTSMESIQNAYQGFAKGNFTMLDNLKLGYGGTKSEMERLLRQAEELEGYMEGSLDIESFADIVEAIHIVQDNMGITGTTAKEAMSTIEGSAKATKAAWQNVITAIGRGEGLSEAFDGLVSSLFGANEGEGLLNQIIPRIETTMQGIGDFIATASPYISDKLPALVSAVIPSALSAGMEMLGAIGEGIINSLPTLVDIVVDVADQIVNGLAQAFPAVLQAGATLFAELVNGLAELAPSIIPTTIQTILDLIITAFDNVPLIVEAAVNLIQGLADGLLAALPVIIEKLPIIMRSIINAVVKSAPLLIDGVIQLVNGVVTALPTIIKALIEALPQIIDAVVNGLLTSLPLLIEGQIQLVLALVEALPQIMQALYDAIPTIIQTLADAVITNLPLLIDGLVQMTAMLVANLPTIVMALIQAIPQIFQMVVDTIMTAAPMLFEAVVSILSTLGGSLMEHGSTFVSNVGETMSNIFNTVVEWLSQLPSQLAYWAGFAIGEFIKFFIELPSKLTASFEAVISNVKAFGENLKTNAINSGKSFFNGIVDNIKNLPSNLRQLASQLVSIVKELPSKFMSIGKNIVDGLWNGIKNGWGNLKNNVTGLFGSLVSGIKDSLGISSPSKVFAEIGKFVDMGYAKGILDNLDVVGTAMAELGNATIAPQITTTPASNTTAQNDVVRLLEEIAAKKTTVILEGDADRLFRVMQSESRRNKQITGQEAFA